MSNPYESPQYEPYKAGYAPAVGPGGVVPSPLVQQVRVLAVLNAVQGGLEMVMGLIQFAMAFLFPALLMIDPNIRDGRDAPPEAFFWVLAVVYGVIGAALLIAGVLRILATVKNWNYRGRVFGIVSLGVGMVSAITCYCAPTGIALLIWGLIVYLNPSVMAAFERGEEGVPAERIIQEFSMYQPPPGY